MVTGKQEIDFLDLVLSHGKVKLKPHILKHISEFPDILVGTKQIQRFLGCLNYVSPFYNGLAKDRKKLQAQLKEGAGPWIDELTEIVQRIKQKCQYLPTLHLPEEGYPLILFTEASDKWSVGRYWHFCLIRWTISVNSSVHGPAPSLS